MSLPVWTCTALGSENATQRRSLGRVSGLIVPQCPARDSATKQRERSARLAPLLCQKTSLSPPPLSLSIGFQAKNERTSRKYGGASGWGKKKKLTGDAGLQRLTSNCCTLHCYSVLGGANLLTTQTSAHIRTSGKRVVSDAERSKLIVIVLQLKSDALSYNLLMISPQEVSSNIRKYWEIKHEHKNVSHSMWVVFFSSNPKQLIISNNRNSSEYCTEDKQHKNIYLWFEHHSMTKAQNRRTLFTRFWKNPGHPQVDKCRGAKPINVS